MLESIVGDVDIHSMQILEFFDSMCVHMGVCVLTLTWRSEGRVCGARSLPSFTGALGLNSLVTRRAGQAISPVYTFTFLFRTLHLRILEWKGAWSLS